MHLGNDFRVTLIVLYINNQEDFGLLERIISNEDNESLCKEVSFEEVKATTFDLAPDKSPRQNGFPLSFFKSIGL